MTQAGKIQSIRQKLLNISNERKIDYNIILIWYTVERLLYRLGRSNYSDRYILKGAMLFSVWSEILFRPTKDIDFLGFGESSPEYLKAVFAEIIQMKSDHEDGLVFVSESLDIVPIREEQEYGGQRITLSALLGTARIRLQIDVGFGDAVTPGPQKVQYPTLLEMPAPNILTYSKETVIAEKFHAITVLGLTTSRMKDYYDLWILSRQFEFEGNVLAKAIRMTFERRKTSVPEQLPPGLTNEFYHDDVILTRWKSFAGRTELAFVETNLEAVILHLQEFFAVMIEALSHDEIFDQLWDKSRWKELSK
jgi:predicted nucleotidyltransferase component of viral defense system